ncbi:hypothetical protein AB0O76_04700 [Streptomyces sp. NPDC086554]|uniref:hypothetical protein n=1 Tax=Streptomyces sp. NPDC086554 TaxID=3154864 RepID=UPI003428B0FD
MSAVSAPKGYRTFYLGKGSVVHAAQDSDTATLCKKPLITVRLAHSPYVSCTRCMKVAHSLNTSAESPTTKAKDTMPPKSKSPAKKPAAKKATAKPTVDVDAVTSDVHALVDQIKAIKVADDDAESKAAGLKFDAEAKILKLPTHKRTALRKAVRDAVEAVTAAKADLRAATSIALSDDPMEWEGLPPLIAHGVKEMRKGVDAGLQLTSAGEQVANVLLTIRQHVIDPETGLPDLVWRLKVTRNSASKVYNDVLNEIAEDDEDRLASHASLIKATNNKASDVLVEWLRGYRRESAEDMELLRELYPAAVDACEADEDLSPEQAIRDLYAEHGIELPVRGRTEHQRLTRRVDKILKITKELEAAQDENDTETVETKQAAIDELKATLPEDMLERLGETHEKTDAEKTEDALKHAWKSLETAGKRAKTLKGAEKRKVKTQMYKKIRALAEEFDLDLSKLVPSDDSE